MFCSKKRDSLFHLVSRDYETMNVWVQLKSGDNRDMAVVVDEVAAYIEAHPPPEPLRREWAGEMRWARWTFRGPAKLERAEVDPDGVLALDADRLNNGKTVEADRAPALAFATDVLYWLASLFQAAALFA